MIFGNKTAIIAELIIRILAPCAASFLRNSTNPAIVSMDAGKKDVLLTLLDALNRPDDVVKKAMKAGQAEILKIQGAN